MKGINNTLPNNSFQKWRLIVFLKTFVLTDMLDVSDLIYRLNWAKRTVDLNNQPMPANLDLSIIMERHYAINWVTFYAEEWDEISTDT